MEGSARRGQRQQEMEGTQEEATERNQSTERNWEEENLLDEEHYLIPGRKKSDANENEQQEATRMDETTGRDNKNSEMQTFGTSSEERERKSRRDLIAENRQLKRELQSIRRGYKEVKQMYESLRQRLRSERKVLRKYRRLLIGAFETDNLPLLREESSGEPQSLSAPSEQPLEESNSEKGVASTMDHSMVDNLGGIENQEGGTELERVQHEQPFDRLVDYGQETRHKNNEEPVNISAASASAAAASNDHGAATATAVASCSVGQRPMEQSKWKRKRDFSKDSSGSAELHSPSSSSSKSGEDIHQPEEEQPPTKESPSENTQGDYNRFEGVESRRGRHSIWKPQEEQLFDEGFRRYGCRWKLIQENFLPHKSRQQIQSHGTYLLRQGRLRKNHSAKHKRSLRDEAKNVEKTFSRTDKDNTGKKASDKSLRPVRQYDEEIVP